ncbi:hypothetical protein BS47DRAFT_1384042 [Hydnum rufescens UP504]|uniref:Histone chaperone RTT106/FACT complex subunit SPT16-like middle domain-containing protein n=1 Tax=Hydnum rufescens UP504 TaxID=1448309 RepID=A0A9P6DPQ3_9AGAM|nr:hypothetical protein BS47DRAFT_1384042 [Hydnum rufescens UP504]
MSSTPYLDVVLQYVPRPLLHDLAQLVQQRDSYGPLLDSIVRLCSEAPPSDRTSEVEWTNSQVQITGLLRQLNAQQSLGDSVKTKRAREALDDVPPASKKVKLDEIPLVEDDPPIFTLHSISVSTPVRKKADVTVHRFTLRLTSPSNNNENLHPPIPIHSLRLAFLVPTPGKSKPYLTAIIMSATASSADTSVIFGCDATAPVAQATTKYPDDKKIHPKGSSTKQLIHSLFAYFPQGPDGLVDLYEPKADDFTSSSGSQSIDAFIGAKDGHLHFFRWGVLWGERKPCMWFPVDDIRDMSTRSATGRAFSLCIVTQTNKKSTSGELMNDGEDGHMEPEVLETTEFNLIDTKESDAVQAWIASHRGDFSKTITPNTSSSESSSRPISKATPLASLVQLSLDESDPEDQDFALSDSDDGGSESSESSREQESEADAELSESDDVGGSADEDAPLKEPGAVPRMNNAAMQLAIGMVKEAFGVQNSAD